jgi:RNAse (barnase) inhibitor barstar
MAWQVALVLDTETDLHVDIGEMPIWAQATPQRQNYAQECREQGQSMWSPDPDFTLITTPIAEDLVERATALLPTIEEHHPNLFCIHVFGILKENRLDAAMAELGYYPATISREPGSTFVRAFEQFAKDLILDASDWNLKSDWYWTQDLYSAFFVAVGAPEWHGRNLDALRDSIGSGGINRIEVPYRIVIRNAPRENEMAKQVLNDFADLIQDLEAKGCPVKFLAQG